MNCEQTERNHCNINYPDPKELLILWQFVSNVPPAGNPLCSLQSWSVLLGIRERTRGTRKGQ